ncbi:MAG: response regulator transcription factor [Leptolyngbyaceae cyanobacterium bins.302]|nr:response regulator transcription factor [Leptolyngbyaceae cyanobacterium bins.302]
MINTQTKPIRILLAEDHDIVRDGIAAVLNSHEQFTVIAQVANGAEAIAAYRTHQPDVTLMDLRMPVVEGVDAIKQIHSEFPQARIIILTTYDTDEDIYRGLQAGAKGYLLKGTKSTELVTAIQQVYNGQRYIPPDVAIKLAQRIQGAELTDRELEVLRLMTKGRGSKEMSAALNVSEGTVRFHINNILSKLGVRDRTQAVLTALRRGLTRLEDI